MQNHTNRDIKKEVQLKHIKEKLYEMRNEKSHKKENLVKNLKNLKKRESRK